MEPDRKKFIAYTIAVVATLLFFSAIYWSANSEPESESETEPEPGDKARFVPGGWTPELMQIYNESEPIESLEYSPFRGVLINKEFEYIDELVILMIPEGVENRASFVCETDVYAWENDNVLIGNNTVLTETEIIKAYVFVDLNVSNTMYDRHEEFNHPTISYKEIEVRGIDLTISPFYDVEVE